LLASSAEKFFEITVVWSRYGRDRSSETDGVGIGSAPGRVKSVLLLAVLERG